MMTHFRGTQGSHMISNDIKTPRHLNIENQTCMSGHCAWLIERVHRCSSHFTRPSQSCVTIAFWLSLSMTTVKLLVYSLTRCDFRNCFRMSRALVLGWLQSCTHASGVVMLYKASILQGQEHHRQRRHQRICLSSLRSPAACATNKVGTAIASLAQRIGC